MLDTNYRPDLGTVELIGVLSRLVAHERIVEQLVCRYLADLADHFAEHRSAALAGYSDVYHAARRLFGMGVRRARERIRIGRALRELPVIERTFVSGDLSYSQVRELTRVAKREDERQWISEAKLLPMRQLEQRVAAAADTDGFRERAADKSREPAALSWRSAGFVDVRVTMRAEAWALLERAMEGARRAAEVGSDGMLSDSEALEAVARDALAVQQKSADGADGPDLRRTVVLYECKRCERTELDTGAGVVALEPGPAAALGCGAKVRDLEREGRTVKRGGAVPRGVMRAVHLRDRGRCRNPGCRRRRYVDVHHIEARCSGGVHARENLCCLCSICHGRLHEGQLVITGKADAELSFHDAHGRRIGAGALDGLEPCSGDPIGSPNVLDETEASLLDIMRTRGAWHPDALVSATGLPVGKVNGALIRLEIAGHVTSDLAGRFQRTQHVQDGLSVLSQHTTRPSLQPHTPW
jgi:hypothetical protein